MSGVVHATTKAAGNTLAAVADWNAIHNDGDDTAFSIFVGSSTPTELYDGRVWIDISTDPPTIKIYDLTDTEWEFQLGTFLIGAHLLPSADDTYDIGGASAQEWRNAYIDGILYVDDILMDDTTGEIRTDTGNLRFHMYDTNREFYFDGYNSGAGGGVAGPTLQIRGDATDSVPAIGFYYSSSTFADTLGLSIFNDAASSVIGSWQASQSLQLSVYADASAPNLALRLDFEAPAAASGIDYADTSFPNTGWWRIYSDGKVTQKFAINGQDGNIYVHNHIQPNAANSYSVGTAGAAFLAMNTNTLASLYLQPLSGNTAIAIQDDGGNSRFAFNDLESGSTDYALTPAVDGTGVIGTSGAAFKAMNTNYITALYMQPLSGNTAIVIQDDDGNARFSLFDLESGSTDYAFIPSTDNTGNVGTSGNRFKAGYFYALNVAGAITVQDIFPSTADTYVLGSATKEWRDLYIGDAGNITLGLGQDATITWVNGTSAFDLFNMTGDTGVTRIAGGSTSGYAEGAAIHMYGQSHAAFPGQLAIYAGEVNNANAYIDFYTATAAPTITRRLRINRGNTPVDIDVKNSWLHVESDTYGIKLSSDGAETIHGDGTNIVFGAPLDMNGNAILGGGSGHDQFSDFVANEHIDHTAVTLTAGDGLTGGGTIAANRTFAVGAGTGIGVNANDVQLSHLGIESLTDPNADRIMFWDDVGAGAVTWLTVGTGLSIAATTLSTDDANIDHGSLGGLGDDDHTIYFLADGSRNLGGNIVPDGASTRDLGTVAAEFANLYIGTGRTYYGATQLGSMFHNGTDVIISSSTDIVLTAGGSNVKPSAANTISLGATDAEWNDIYLGTGRLHLYTDQHEYIYSNGTNMYFGVGAAGRYGMSTTAFFPTTDSVDALGTTSLRFSEIHVDTIIEDFVADADHSVGAGARTIEATAGENIVPGELVYLKLSDGKWWKTDADAEATSTGMLGISVDTTNAEATGTILIEGVYRDDTWAWTTTGSSLPLFVDTTAGDLSETAPSGSGDFVRVAAHSISDDEIYFRPDGAWVEVV